MTLVGIIDADAGLLSTDFRATERMAQLIIQVSGRAGREDRPGVVFIQTHYPGHPLLQALVTRDYDEFAGLLLSERRRAQLPPYSYQALLGAEAASREAAEKFLQCARRQLAKLDTGLSIHGPVSAPIEKRKGRFRNQLLILSANRKSLEKSPRTVVPVTGRPPGGKTDTVVPGCRSPGYVVTINGAGLD